MKIFKIHFSRTICNFGIFTTLVYLSSNILLAQEMLRNLSNMYDGLLSTEPCVSAVYSELKAYSKPSQIWKILYTTLYIQNIHIQDLRHIQNTAKHLSQNLLFKTSCNPDTFRILVYLELWYALKSKHIQNPG